MRFGLVLACVVCAGAGRAGEQQATPPPAPAADRTELNIVGQTDAQAGESRRNENIQFNPIDNNVLKELNIRLGATATIVEEFRADRNYYGAEYGNTPPALLHVEPSRLAAFHGGLFWGHNNSVFAGRSFFQAGSVQPARTNDYGFNLGGPVWDQGALSLEAGQQKIRGSVNGNVLVPRPDERTALAADPVTRRLVERFLAAYPSQPPNRTDINERALNTNAPQTIDTGNWGLHLDQRRDSRDRFSADYRFLLQTVDAFELVAGQNPDTLTRSHAVRLTWTRLWSANTSLDFSAGFDRLRNLIAPEPNAVGPYITVGGVIEPLGPGSAIPIDRTQNQFRNAAGLVCTRGSHTLRAGFEVLRRQINGRESSSHRGTIYFLNDYGRDALTNFRLGVPSRFSVGLGDVNRGFRQWAMQFFAGDTWQATRNLSLSYGLRLQPVTAPVEADGRNTVPYGCSCGAFSPRFGFARRLPGRWGLLRGAYGLHYGEIFPVTFQQVRFNPPGVQKIELHGPSLTDPLGALSASDFGPGARAAIFELDPLLTAPYSHQYNFTFEPVLARNWKLQVGYVGSRTHRLLMMWYTNRARPVPGIPQTNDTVNSRRPDARHFDVRRVVNGSRAYYDAARASLVFPRWRGLSFEASYWFSKALDLGANYTSPGVSGDTLQVRSQSEFDVVQDLKGRSTFDQPHAFLFRGAWDAPRRLGRWSLSAVALLKSGTPFDVFSGSDAPGYGNVDGSSGDRPNLLEPSILGRVIGHPDSSRRLLPRSAFGFIRPDDDRGNLGHHVFRKGGIRNVNAALGRTWSLGGEKALTLRAESVNFFNTPQFAEPGKELTSPSFGQITNTLNDGRTFRFLLRLRF